MSGRDETRTAGDNSGDDINNAIWRNANADVRSCRLCGALVEYAALPLHRRWHERPAAEFPTGFTERDEEEAVTQRQARYVVRKADHVGGKPIPDDEPVLVIRAQDRLAVRMMRLYVDMYTLLEDHQDVVVDELNEHLDDLVGWQLEHPTKTADR